MGVTLIKFFPSKTGSMHLLGVVEGVDEASLDKAKHFAEQQFCTNGWTLKWFATYGGWHGELVKNGTFDTTQYLSIVTIAFVS